VDSSTVERWVIVVADALVVVPVLVAASSLFATATAALTVVGWRVRGLYDHRIALSSLDDLPSLAGSAIVAAAPASAMAMSWGHVRASNMFAVVGAIIVGCALSRGLGYGLILRERARGRFTHPTVVVGSGAPVAALAHRIESHPESGLRLVGAVTDQPTSLPSSLPLLGGSQQLALLLARLGVHDVVVGYGGLSNRSLVDVLRDCDRADVAIHVVPRFFELHHPRVGDDHIWDMPVVRLRRPAERLSTWPMKRLFDVLIAALALALAAPLLLLIALAVRIKVGPGVIFRQTRVGKDGRLFQMLKFRSLPDPPAGAERGWTVAKEDIGSLGRLLRRYSLDELPQLVNVLKGDMSLVGPRPERPEYVQVFSVQVPRYVHRHRLPVGLTGWAAVNGLRGDTSIDDRAAFDNWYIENWSLWLDVKILARTAIAVVTGAGR
jgi:exopolysaccharide biosynthesis polyprenyl glycosylphosphotransferase